MQQNSMPEGLWGIQPPEQHLNLHEKSSVRSKTQNLITLTFTTIRFIDYAQAGEYFIIFPYYFVSSFFSFTPNIVASLPEKIKIFFFSK